MSFPDERIGEYYSLLIESTQRGGDFASAFVDSGGLSNPLVWVANGYYAIENEQFGAALYSFESSARVASSGEYCRNKFLEELLAFGRFEVAVRINDPTTQIAMPNFISAVKEDSLNNLTSFAQYACALRINGAIKKEQFGECVNVDR